MDKNSEGLMLLTNDGDLSYRLTHPKFKHQKTYMVWLEQPHDIFRKHLNNIIKIFIKGIKLDGNLARFDIVKFLKLDRNKAVLKITMHQGIKRQIRRMFEKYNYSVVKLKRIQIAKLKLGQLKPKQYQKISKKDIL